MTKAGIKGECRAGTVLQTPGRVTKIIKSENYLPKVSRK